MSKLILLYSDLIGGFLGIVGSVILAYPFISEISDRRHWEALIEFRQRIRDPKIEPVPEEQEAYRAIRDRMIDDRLGQHNRYRWITIVGFVFLLGAFAFMTAASFERFLSHS